MRRFRQALITVCIVKLLVFCQSAGCSASRGQKTVCAVLAVSRDTIFDMLGCGGDRNINLPSPPKKKSEWKQWRSSHCPVCDSSATQTRMLREPRAFLLMSLQNLTSIWHPAKLHFISVQIHFCVQLLCAHLCGCADCLHGASGWDTIYQRYVLQLFIAGLGALSHHLGGQKLRFYLAL